MTARPQVGVVFVDGVEFNPGWRGGTPATHTLVMTAGVDEMLTILDAFRAAHLEAASASLAEGLIEDRDARVIACETLRHVLAARIPRGQRS